MSLEAKDRDGRDSVVGSQAPGVRAALQCLHCEGFNPPKGDSMAGKKKDKKDKKGK